MDNYAFSLEAMKRTKMLRLTDFYDPQSAFVIPDVFETATTIFTEFNDNKDCKAKAGSVEAYLIGLPEMFEKTQIEGPPPRLNDADHEDLKLVLKTCFERWRR